MSGAPLSHGAVALLARLRAEPLCAVVVDGAEHAAAEDLERAGLVEIEGGGGRRRRRGDRWAVALRGRA